jgi:hypothetical protein
LLDFSLEVSLNLEVSLDNFSEMGDLLVAQF